MKFFCRANSPHLKWKGNVRVWGAKDWGRGLEVWGVALAAQRCWVSTQRMRFGDGNPPPKPPPKGGGGKGGGEKRKEGDGSRREGDGSRMVGCAVLHPPYKEGVFYESGVVLGTGGDLWGFGGGGSGGGGGQGADASTGGGAGAGVAVSAGAAGEVAGAGECGAALLSGDADGAQERDQRMLNQAAKDAPKEENPEMRIANWVSGPVEKVPVEEARTQLEAFRKVLHEVELGAQRRDCDSGVRPSGGGGRAGDAADSGDESPGSAGGVRVRLAVREGKADEAVHWLQVGYALENMWASRRRRSRRWWESPSRGR